MIPLTNFAQAVMQEMFLKEGETPEACFKRVARWVSSKEANPKKWEQTFFKVMERLDFLPNSPTLFNAGANKKQLSACFVIDIDDSLEGIFNSLKEMALIQATGGGVGMAFSKLRPRGDVVSTTRGQSSGPVSFLKIFDTASNAIKQGGMRRGANMGILHVCHPDIEEFISCKKQEGQITCFNLSVAATDHFMKKYKENGLIELKNPRNNQLVKKLAARDVMRQIAENAWLNGEPGMFFIDKANQKNTVKQPIFSTNPCGEQPLSPYESCNLGSLNLANMTRAKHVDWWKLKNTITVAVRFLDNVIDVTTFPLEKIERETKKNRRIGLGVMGWHDMLIELGIPYDSLEALQLAEKIMKFIQANAFRTSVDLAKEKGVFPNVKNSIWKSKSEKPRNAAVTTIAPTGTLSIIANCSSGIEPWFSLVYDRKALGSSFEVQVKWLEKFGLDVNRVKANGGTLKGLSGVDSEVQRLLKTALEIDPSMHVRMQAAFQKHVDAAVSKTINLPETATKEDVEKIFYLAWQLNCKGITVYRNRSRKEQILITKPKKMPTVLEAQRVKLRAGCGNLYTVISKFNNEPMEIFTNIGKAGGCANAVTEALCRIISIALRSGTPLKEIARQLRGIRCPHPGVDEELGIILSCPDGMGRAIETVSGTVISIHAGSCPECGGKVLMEEGCQKCTNCSYVRCG